MFHMELGSNFELDLDTLEPKNDSIYYYLRHFNTIYVDSGRSASAILNTLIRKGTVLLPDYICESVIRVYKAEYQIKYYHINNDFSVDMDDLMNKVDGAVTALYLMHYFGTLQNTQVLEDIHAAKEKYGFVIIEDTTHSIFTKSHTIGDYCICSLRKWFPVADGGVLYTEKTFEKIDVCKIPVKKITEKLTAMLLKKLYIDGRIDNHQLYREIFEKEENKLDQQKQVYQISEISGSLLKNYSVSELIKKRKENDKILKETLQNFRGGEVVFRTNDYVPLTCPVYIEDRDRFRQYLSDHCVYCAVHWPLEKTELYSMIESRHKSEHIISLPVDQRYGRKHMHYLQELIKGYR